jgi:iron complex transport system ATP-binding protein
MTDALEATDVSVRRGQREIVAQVSLVAHYGALVAIVGPNGAGKTTLLKALAGLLPHSGSVRVAGAALDSLSAAARARSLAYVPQRSLMADGVSVYDVVAQARYAHRGALGDFARGVDPAVQQALARTGLEPLARRAFDTLSGGEQRRVLTARALASQARVLLLDEPSAGLDVAHALRLFQLLAELRAEGYALICVLHDLDEVRRHADSTLLLHHGRCVAHGPSAELLRAERLRQVYGVFAHENVGLGFSLDGRWP